MSEKIPLLPDVRFAGGTVAQWLVYAPDSGLSGCVRGLAIVILSKREIIKRCRCVMTHAELIFNHF